MGVTWLYKTARTLSILGALTSTAVNLPNYLLGGRMAPLHSHSERLFETALWTAQNDLNTWQRLITFIGAIADSDIRIIRVIADRAIRIIRSIGGLKCYYDHWVYWGGAIADGEADHVYARRGPAWAVAAVKWKWMLG